MPFDISCTNCGRTLRVPDDGAGKHVKCPQCQTVLLAPSNSSAGSGSSGGGVSSVGGISSVGGASAANRTTTLTTAEMWHLKGADGQTYGPVPKAELDNWCREGRVASNSQILRDGGNQWQWATDLYPHLSQSSPISNGSANGSPYATSGAAYGGNPYTSAAASGHNPYGATVNPYSPGGYSGYGGTQQLSDKSKIAAGLLGLFLGAYGIHRFYLGDVGIGVAQIVVTLVTCGIGGIWGPIEGIMILCGAIDRDSEGRKLRD